MPSRRFTIRLIRILFAVILLLVAAKMLTSLGLGGLFESHENGKVHYDVVFGKGDVDLTSLTPAKAPHDLEVNAVFGQATVYIDPESPVRVVSNSVFGQSSMPDESEISFGTLNYRTPTAGATLPSDEVIFIRTNVVFGSVQIRAREATGAPHGP